jgi:tripartite-type tricarboxylate transporter receptor subunit TctC
VPAFPELSRTEEGRRMLEFYVSAEQIGRSIVAPPKAPADRVAMLRRAFDQAMKDPGLLADIQKARADFSPMSGEDLQKTIEQVASVSPDIVQKMQAILR